MPFAILIYELKKYRHGQAGIPPPGATPQHLAKKIESGRERRQANLRPLLALAYYNL
jgi:hypothetical protein